MAITSIAQNIDALCSEHGLDRDLIIEVLKDAIKAAARRHFKIKDPKAKDGTEIKADDPLQVDWNMEDGSLEISVVKTVVEEVENPSVEVTLEEVAEMGVEDVEIGDALMIPLPMEELGRIAAQTAKQILVQKVREAVREKVYEEYIDRKGDLINGTVKRFERGDMIVDLGNNLEAVAPRNQLVRSEQWSQGERIRVVIHDITKDSKGPQIIVSRASEELLKRLFEMEVPEIYDDTVVIKSAVREPGERAKIAVASNEKDVDPVGACVGMKGSRVQSIIRELRGEKIDIIEWSDEPSVFAANALAPAKVSQVRITDIQKRQIEVIVIEDQLSLAIGKHGQNVRLATRLVGWNIDIRSEAELKKEIAIQMSKMMAAGESVPVEALEGVSAAQAEDLKEKGIVDIDALAGASVDNLVDYLDISMDEAEKILGAAKAVVELRDSTDEAEAAGEAETETEAEAEPAEEAETETETETEAEPAEEAADEEETAEEVGEEVAEAADEIGESEPPETTDLADIEELAEEMKIEEAGEGSGSSGPDEETFEQALVDATENSVEAEDEIAAEDISDETEDMDPEEAAELAEENEADEADEADESSDETFATEEAAEKEVEKIAEELEESDEADEK
jgi:N utilization substance protein A